MGEAPFVSAAALLQTAHKLCHRRKPDGSLNRGASPFLFEIMLFGGSFRLEIPDKQSWEGFASSPIKLTRLHNIYLSERYQESSIGTDVQYIWENNKKAGPI
jgi:hypothetical protein